MHELPNWRRTRSDQKNRIYKFVVLRTKEESVYILIPENQEPENQKVEEKLGEEVDDHDIDKTDAENEDNPEGTE
ncbi:MAG: hypothetical protein NTW10_03360 [Bacteroidetes bacterium]|nr:hypothetical protein [Bacteroidota bacterium]